MEEPEPLFRQEALDFAAGQRGPGELLRTDARQTDRLYWLLLILVVVGVALSLLIQVDGEPLLFVIAPALKQVFP
jgi:hypothetical protein